jgi:hypothetical protein
MRDGVQTCTHCANPFEARVFRPPQRSARVLQLAQSGPEGATSCANHARNAAVASCERCGLFICSLCEIALEAGRFCPSCFERMSKEGHVEGATNRFRDYGSLSAVAAVVGLFMFPITGLPLGILSIYYAVKAFRNRAESTMSTTGIVLAISLAIIDIGLGLFFLGTIFFAKFFS